MKGSHFGFGSPQQQVDMHARSKNTFIVYKMHLFLPYLLVSKTIRLTIHFSKHPPILRDANLQWLVRLVLGIRFKNDSFQI